MQPLFTSLSVDTGATVLCEQFQLESTVLTVPTLRKEL